MRSGGGGGQFTAAYINEITAMVDETRTLFAMDRGSEQISLLWLGNSQLHTINQYQDGDHLAPFWLRKTIGCGGCLVPLGVSLPDANLQEHYVLARHASLRIPLSLLVVELVFDDLRNDGLRSDNLRDDFSILLSAELRADLWRHPIGQEILDNFDNSKKVASGTPETAGLQGFVQKSIEDSLVDGLGNVFPLWADRPNLRAKLLTDLYYTRNWVLNIKPMTARKMIKPRYERNMKALEAMISGMRRDGVPVLLYIAPIRHDLPLPYDLSEYEAWKKQVQKLAAGYGVGFINLERLVPAQYWGTYHEDDVDFMHFQGEGHKLLAQALLPEVKKLLARRGDEHAF
jgi:hypothetical protein